MARILVIERSPLIATDIVETVCQEFPRTEAVAVASIEDAEMALNGSSIVDICIVSGSTTRDRLERLAAMLDDKNVRIVAITDEASKLEMFGKGAVHLSHPFTSDMLIQAVRCVSRDESQDSAPLSDPE